MGLRMFKKLFEEKQVRIFYIIAMLIGIIMSIMISVWMIPDEDNHLELIEKAIKNPTFMDNLEMSLGMDRGRVEWDESQAIDVKQFFSAMIKKPDYTVREMLPQGFSLSVLKYLPCVLGMELGILLHLPTFWVLQLGELFSLILYVFICGQALKVCPFKKGVMAIFMLSPMMMQGAGSFSHDAIVVPLIFWIISYVFYLRYEKEKIDIKDIAKLVGAWLVVTYIKVPYTFIVLLGLMLPLRKMHIRIGKAEINEQVVKKYRWPALAVILVMLGVGIYLFRDNVWIQIIYGVVVEFPRTLYLLAKTAQHFAGHLIVSSVGNFGWLNAPVSPVFGVLFYVIILLISVLGTDGSKNRMNKWDRGVIWVTFFSLTLMILFSMINHTITTILFGSESAEFEYNIREALYQIPFIGGLQGRYFMPFISLFFMQFGSLEKIDKRTTKILIGAFGAITYLYVGYVLLNRFWIAG